MARELTLVRRARASIAAVLLASACVRGGKTPGCAEQPALAPPAPAPAAATAGTLCITEGDAISGSGVLRTDAPALRGVLPGSRGDALSLRFRVLGPSREARALGSGALRTQVGLKLRARDGCNVLYAMWRGGEQGGVVVSLKANPAARASSECGNAGYTNLRPEAGHVGPLPMSGEHTLSARLEGRSLRVVADGALAWSGQLPADLTLPEGPCGLRTDNVALELLELSVDGEPVKSCTQGRAASAPVRVR